MNKYLFAVLAFILIACSKDDAVTNELNIAPNQYGLKVISRYEDYTATIKADSNNRLMNLEAIIPEYSSIFAMPPPTTSLDRRYMILLWLSCD